MLSLATRIICFVLATQYVKAALESPEYYFAGANSTSNKRQCKDIPMDCNPLNVCVVDSDTRKEYCCHAGGKDEICDVRAPTWDRN
jgi:hypothetical protein